MASNEQWSTNANEAFEITLDKPDGSEVSFNPLFTYPIFGEEETIFGYSGLELRLRYKSDTLKPKLRTKYAKKFTAVGDSKADDLDEALKPFIPAWYEPSSQEEQDLVDTKPYTPPGKQIHTYTRGDSTYAIYASQLSDRKTKELLRRIQTLIPLFIEGGTLIDLDLPEWTFSRWTIFFLYETTGSTYSLTGYSTAYGLYYLPPTPSATPDPETDLDAPDSTTTLPQRQRISQFLILPPYQAQGHGSNLYNAVWSYFHANPAVTEITVEDPNENFDDMRDINDLVRLRTHQSSFTSLTMNTSVSIPDRNDFFPSETVLPRTNLEKARSDSKVADRQFDRLVEMQLLSRIPEYHRNINRLSRKEKSTDENDRRYWFWRMLLRRRLYKHNRDALILMSWEERMENLDKVMGTVEEDYGRLLRDVDKRMEKVRDEAEANGAKEGRARVGKKRVIEDDEDEEGEASAGAGAGASSSRKKSRAA